MTALGSTPAAPQTSITVGTDVVYPTSIRYADEDGGEQAANMYDHKNQYFLTTNKKTVSFSWFGPTAPSWTVGSTYDVSVTAGTAMISLTGARLREFSHDAQARGAWSCSATFELEES